MTVSEQSIFSLLTCCIVLIILPSVVKSLYQSFLLRNVPGPWYTLLSDWALLWHEYKHNRTRWIHGLHVRHGPIVRLSNSEVHYNSVEAVKTLYGVRGRVAKDAYYAEFAKDGQDNMFSTIADVQHAERKRGVANHYARSSLLTDSSLAMIWEKVAQFCALIDDPKGVELYTTLSYFTFDVISSVVYGSEYCAGTLVDNTLNRARIQTSDQARLRNWRRFWRKAGHDTLALLAQLLSRARQYLGSRAEYSSNNNGDLDSYISETCKRLLTSCKETVVDDQPSLAEKLLARGCTDAYMLSETRDHVIAGSDTTTTVLTYLFYTLTTKADIYSLLRTAVEELGRDEHGHLTISELESCVYLDAIITEALRLFAAIPMTLPRVLTASLDLHHHTIPPGMRIGVQCYSMHRDPAVFPDPEAFKPDRWLDAAKSVHDHMWSFSSGSRSCIGKALAMLEMKMIVAEVISRFQPKLVGLINAGSIEMLENTTAFSMAPRDTNMKLRFERRIEN